MNTIAILIGGVLVLFSFMMLYGFWHQTQSNSAAFERTSTWQTEFGLTAYVLTLVAPFFIFGTYAILVSFKPTLPFAHIVERALLLVCSIGIGYFYFSKKREINNPSTATQKVFSDMRDVGVWILALALSGDWLIPILISLAVKWVISLLGNNPSEPEIKSY